MREMKDSGISWIGEIPKNIQMCRIKFLFDMTKGKLPTSTNNDKIGQIYVGATEMNGGDSNIYTTDTDLPTCTPEDILILWDGANSGLVATEFEGVVSSTVVKITSHNKNVDKRYLYYIFKCYEKYFKEKVNGTTIPHMNMDYINDIPFLMFSVEEQQKISKYLDSKCFEIDALIKGKQEQNESLKQYKKSLIYETVTKGLNKNVEMKDSGISWIGQIPKHWGLKKLKTIFSIMPGATPKSSTSNYWDGEIVWITPADYKTDDIYITNGRKNITKEGLKSCATTMIPINSLIFSKRAPVGLVAINKVALCTNQGCLSCIPKSGINYKYYYYVLASFTEQFNILASGTTFKEISSDTFSAFKVTYTDEKEQQQIVDLLDKKCEEIDKAISINDDSIKELKEYKQSVIYEAVTGKIEV